MQATLNQIVNKVSKEEDLDEMVLQSISNTVFQTISENIKKPKNLILYVKGLGKIYARKKKTADHLVLYRKAILNPKPSQSAFLSEYIKSMEFILEEYKRYDEFKTNFKNNAINYNNTNN